jgi:hypothetical protein
MFLKIWESLTVTDRELEIPKIWKGKKKTYQPQSPLAGPFGTMACDFEVLV